MGDIDYNSCSLLGILDWDLNCCLFWICDLLRRSNMKRRGLIWNNVIFCIFLSFIFVSTIQWWVCVTWIYDAMFTAYEWCYLLRSICVIVCLFSLSLFLLWCDLLRKWWWMMLWVINPLSYLINKLMNHWCP